MPHRTMIKTVLIVSLLSQVVWSQKRPDQVFKVGDYVGVRQSGSDFDSCQVTKAYDGFVYGVACGTTETVTQSDATHIRPRA